MTASVPLPRSASGATALDIALRCAHEAGALALSRFRGAHDIGIKGHRNIVTEADLQCETLVKQILAAEFPDHRILSEETAYNTDPSEGWVWVVDPIDGTKNYAAGIPFWCVNVALCLDADPVIGVTFDAVHAETFVAVAGEGATVNGVPIRASDAPDVRSSVISVDLGYSDAMGEQQIDMMKQMFPDVLGIRITGSAALGIAYAACGRFDLYTHMNVSPWDVAAGILLIREAGGAASDRSGGPMRITSSRFVAGARGAHDDFVSRYARQQGDSRGA